VIFEFFFQMGASVQMWFLGLIPPMDDASDAILDANAAFVPVMQGAAALKPWLPWDVLLYCLLVAVSWWIGFLLLKLARVLWSYLPFIGGSTS